MSANRVGRDPDEISRNSASEKSEFAPARREKIRRGDLLHRFHSLERLKRDSRLELRTVVSSLLFHVSVGFGYTPETFRKLTISLAPFQRATSDWSETRRHGGIPVAVHRSIFGRRGGRNNWKSAPEFFKSRFEMPEKPGFCAEKAGISAKIR